MRRVATYMRVSSQHQETAMQQHALKEWLAARPDCTVVARFEDYAISGKRDNRPGFLALCAAVDAGEIDAVLTYRLDRISRRAVTALQTLIDWTRAGVEFFAVDQPILNTAKDDPFRLTKLAMFAELAEVESKTFGSRVRTGMAAAKAKGVMFGAKQTITEEQVRHFMALRKSGMSGKRAARAAGMSRAQAMKRTKALTQ